MDLTGSRAFLLLRYTLIAATAYLLLVEREFSPPPIGTILLLVAALASNVMVAQLPSRLTSSPAFSPAIIVADTVWITAVLVQSGTFNTEFYFLYFFVLLLAAIGESLPLIVIGTVAVCIAYVYLLLHGGGVWKLWSSPSLIRIPFLFSTAAFYGYLVDRARQERRRADAHEAEQKRATRQLAHVTSDFSQLIETANALIVGVDGNKLVNEWNQKVAELTGHSRSEMVGRMIVDEFVPIDHRMGVERVLDQALAGQESGGFEFPLHTKDGRRVTILFNTTTRRDAAGEIVGCWVVGQDITERKRAEEEKADLYRAQEEETEIAAALARVGREMVSSLDTPVLLDRLCAVTAQVLECDISATLLCSPAEEMYQLVAAYGLTEEERGVAQVVKVPPGAASVLFSRLEKDDVAQVGTIPEEVIAKERQEQLGVTVLLCMALRRGSGIIGLQVAYARSRVEPFTPQQWRIARGIAQLASLALENARLAAEANEASRLKSEFVATISHELRTPLNVIMGYTALMLDGEFGPLTTDQTSTLRDMSKNSEDLLQLIAATLDLSRLEKGQVPVEFRETDLSVLLREISDDTQAHWEKPEVSFQCHMAPELPLLYSDPGKLKVVLKNLIGNAVKFTERGSVSVEAQVCDGGIEFSVTDTGIGIASKDLPVIFEPFRQADGARTRHYRGAGLGLHIVRRLLDLLSGQITVDSELGRGSTFRAWIPRSPTTCRAPFDPAQS